MNPTDSKIVVSRGNPEVAEVAGNLNHLEVSDDYCIKCKKPFPDETDGIKCSRNPLQHVDDRLNDLTIDTHVNVHKLCGECIVKAASFVAEKPEYIVANGIGLDCMDPSCGRLFLVSDMRRFLPPEIENNLQEKVFHQSIEAFCHDNPQNHIFTCSDCGLGDLIDETIRFHECRQCKFYQCWVCGRLATKAHEIRSCEEMDQAERNPSRGFLFYASKPLPPPRFV